MSMNNTIFNFFETYCFSNYEVACYHLNTDENTLSDMMSYEDDLHIDKAFLHTVKSKLAFDTPTTEIEALTNALRDSTMRLEAWEANAINLQRGGTA